MDFIKFPNLPEKDVRAVICGAAAGLGVIAGLRRLGARVCPLPKCGSVSPGVSGHADMLCHHLGGGKWLFLQSVYEASKDMLDGLGIEAVTMPDPERPCYPYEAALNALGIGGRLICNPRTVHPAILETYAGREIMEVNQGYTRCAAAVVSRDAIITADRGVCDAARSAGMDVLLISPGGVKLPGYPCGFIGGACGLTAPGVLAFAGDVGLHPDGEKIAGFCRDHEVEITALHAGPLRDVGGILPVLERSSTGGELDTTKRRP